MAASITLRNIADKYVKFVVENVDTVSKIESAVRFSSYLIPARVENGVVFSELLYSSCNLLVLLHDTILREATNSKVTQDVHSRRIATLLTVLDYTEVVLELSAKHWGSTRSKWICIFCVQVTKAVMRYVLLARGCGIQSSPCDVPLNRDQVAKQLKQQSSSEQKSGSLNHGMMSSPSMGTLFGMMGANESQTNTNSGPVMFQLKRSKRTMRTLEAAPPMSQRTWTLPVDTEAQILADSQPTKLNSHQYLAEVIHIARPTAHLLSSHVCGLESWKPFFLSFGMDVSSMLMMGDSNKFNPTEREELKRRGYMLILYLLRSPFYDRFTRLKLMILLHVIAYKVPLAGHVAKPLIEYLPFWQKVYSYVWMV